MPPEAAAVGLEEFAGRLSKQYRTMSARVFVLTVLALMCCGIAPAPGQDAQSPDAAPDVSQFFPDVPLGRTVSEVPDRVCPGVMHIHRVTDDPMNINILVVDLSQPGVSMRTCLSHGTVRGVETVRDMVKRTGAVAGVNGDYWSPNGVEQGLTVADGEIVIAPKYRTAFAIRKDGTAAIGMWSDAWSWQAYATAQDGSKHDITMMNSDCGEDWLCLYTSKYGAPTPGSRLSPVTEVLLSPSGTVSSIRTDKPGVAIPKGWSVLTGRGSAGQWLREHVRAFQKVTVTLKSSKPLDDLQQAIGAGPRILKDGYFFQDPLKGMPDGEEFTSDWKKEHYLLRQPRTAVGVSKDGRKVVLITVDGRQPDFSLGIYQKQMAELLVEFGAHDGMDLDSGGSATMVVEGTLVSHPSDKANKDGTGGVERPVANGLMVFCAQEE